MFFGKKSVYKHSDSNNALQEKKEMEKSPVKRFETTFDLRKSNMKMGFHANASTLLGSHTIKND